MCSFAFHCHSRVHDDVIYIHAVVRLAPRPCHKEQHLCLIDVSSFVCQRNIYARADVKEYHTAVGAAGLEHKGQGSLAHLDCPIAPHFSNHCTMEERTEYKFLK